MEETLQARVVNRSFTNERPTKLYKYASLDKPQYFFDTLANRHLYAGMFTEMNDPMEGTYSTPQLLHKDIKDSIFGQKSQFRFCALSPSPYRTLMWSYYGKEHTGYCLELDVQDYNDDDNLVKMEYNNNIPRNIECNEEAIKSLLSRKFTDWAHEEEWRYFVTNGKYWNDIKITKIYFGEKVSDEDFALYKGIIKKLYPEVDNIDEFVVRMEITELMQPENRIDTSNKIPPKITMTKEEVKKILENNPNYQNLINEFEGPFYCDYKVGNLNFRIFNQVGGMPAIYMLLPDNNDVDLKVAHEFSNYAKEILQSEYRRANSNV